MPEGSYTTSLFKKGVNKMAQKVGEEAVETIIEATNGNNEKLIYEFRPSLSPHRSAHKQGLENRRCCERTSDASRSGMG